MNSLLQGESDGDPGVVGREGGAYNQNTLYTYMNNKTK